MTNKSPPMYPARLTDAQRLLLSQIAPEFADRLKLDETNQRSIPFAIEEMKRLLKLAEETDKKRTSGVKWKLAHGLVQIFKRTIDEFQGLGAIRASERIYQFKITLLDSNLPIWRRIQVRDCTLDKLHERVQTAMGWTNSHLNHFFIGDKLYGDPLLLDENFDEMGYEDSTVTQIRAILPKDGKPFSFIYEYDFGDSWRHEILFEGCLKSTIGKKYPLCLEGARACPPEDVGGTTGYSEYLIALADSEHEEHEQFLEWRGEFDSEAFDAEKATKRMWRGIFDWRKQLYDEQMNWK